MATLRTRRRRCGALACTLFVILAFSACSGRSAEQAIDEARERQEDMKSAIDPLLMAYEHQTGVSAELWRDGPITAGCEQDSARARQSYHYAIPASGDAYAEVVDDALQTMIDFSVEVPLDLREHYAGETIAYTANDGNSFHEVTEFWRDGYMLTLIVHAAPGEEPNQVVLVVDAYSTCV